MPIKTDQNFKALRCLLVVPMLLAFSLASYAQVAPKLSPEGVAANQEVAGVNLELSMYRYEPEKSFGKKSANAANTGKLISKRASRDTDGDKAANVKMGESIVVCVYSSRSGTITLWSQIEDQPPVKIYPNKFTPTLVSGAAPINEDEEACVGQNQEFRLRVRGKEGQIDKVYAHWAPDSSAQLSQTDYPEIGRSARAPKSVATYSSTTVAYRITN